MTNAAGGHGHTQRTGAERCVVQAVVGGERLMSGAVLPAAVESRVYDRHSETRISHMGSLVHLLLCSNITASNTSYF